MLDVTLYKEFFFYCQKNDIPIDPSQASIEHGFSIEGDDVSSGETLSIAHSERDIFTTIKDYQQSAVELQRSHFELQEEFPKEQLSREQCGAGSEGWATTGQCSACGQRSACGECSRCDGGSTGTARSGSDDSHRAV